MGSSALRLRLLLVDIARPKRVSLGGREEQPVHKVSVLIPVYSEVGSVEQTVNLVLAGLGKSVEEILLLVHRSSIPACLELCHRLEEGDPRVRVLLQKEYPGQGYAY